MKNLDHVRIGNTKQGRYRLFCLHCGQHYDPALPISMDMFSAVIKSFKKDHRNHEPGETAWTAEEIMKRPYPVEARLLGRRNWRRDGFRFRTGIEQVKQ